MKHPHKKKNNQLREIALSRISELLKQADLRFSKNYILSDRYSFLAKKISMKYKVKLPREQKRRICKKCFAFLVPGANCRVRLTNHKVVIYCLRCKNFTRIPYNRRL